MRLAITGAGGFLGTNLIKDLIKNTRHEIIAITSHPKKFETISLNSRLTSTIDYREIDWNSVDILLNLAFPRNSNGVQMAKGLRYINEVLLYAVSHGVRVVVNISSQSVYSQKRLEPATEDTELNLESSYAVGKYATELLTNTICKDIPHTNIRLASLIGPGFDQRIVNKFVKKAIAGEEIKIVGGKQRFGFLDIRDTVSGLESLINSDSDKWDEVYNLGTNDSYTLEEIAKIVCEKCKGAYIVDRTDDWQNSALENCLFIGEICWKPKYTLLSSIETIIGDAQRE